MHYVLCKTRVTDYDAWRKVFDSHGRAHLESGLHLLNVFRDADDPDLVMVFMRADDPAKARAITHGSSAEQGAADSGLIGEPEVWHFEW